MASGTIRRRALALAAVVTAVLAGGLAYGHRTQPSEMHRMSAAASTFPVPAGFRPAVDDDIECGNPRLCDQDHYVIRWIQTDAATDPCKAVMQAARRWRRDGFEPSEQVVFQTGADDCGFRGSMDGHFVYGWANHGKEPGSAASAARVEPAVIVLNVVTGPASRWLPSNRCKAATTSTQPASDDAVTLILRC